ncbi:MULTISPECIES: hypothetical protein [Sphingomonadales]|jgi:hypothetical protein|uniref:Uncharacterized protein n=2 Tax=Sphingomonadaceae TaxID=41297 RepID=A0A397PIR6_9SPHN|nr:MULTISPECIES: hypothetical protein [Sphingomonadaceae]EKU73333.1 hypothetical protein HMPREF9718_03802 [Sphingobium yanoikuyae ATCC 51230]RIA46034.1 hypothetical protein DFR49_0563 [Hephaestia caeni]WQE08115.1 hypothetical protein U0025_04305 [Sphingobium yanoikuyae]
MDTLISFSIQLKIGSFADEPPTPTQTDLDYIARSIRDAVEHYRANEGLTDEDSSIWVQNVTSVIAETG